LRKFARAVTPAKPETALRLTRFRSLAFKRSRQMRISARNQLKGTVVDVKKGQTTSHVRIELGAGAYITSSITNEAVDELGLAAGDKVTAIIKASDVMVGK